jgi:hypothetical protein
LSIFNKISVNNYGFLKKKYKSTLRIFCPKNLINKNIDKNAVVYLVRWGLTNLWKVGRTTDIFLRLKEFNNYIPINEFNKQPIWTFVLAKKFSMEKKLILFNKKF